jgi:hypothetical protein
VRDDRRGEAMLARRRRKKEEGGKRAVHGFS